MALFVGVVGFAATVVVATLVQRRAGDGDPTAPGPQGDEGEAAGEGEGEAPAARAPGVAARTPSLPASTGEQPPPAKAVVVPGKDGVPPVIGVAGVSDDLLAGSPFKTKAEYAAFFAKNHGPAKTTFRLVREAMQAAIAEAQQCYRKSGAAGPVRVRLELKLTSGGGSWSSSDGRVRSLDGDEPSKAQAFFCLAPLLAKTFNGTARPERGDLLEYAGSVPFSFSLAPPPEAEGRSP
jgi:hypothetical protein